MTLSAIHRALSQNFRSIYSPGVARYNHVLSIWPLQGVTPDRMVDVLAKLYPGDRWEVIAENVDNGGPGVIVLESTSDIPNHPLAVAVATYQQIVLDAVHAATIQPTPTAALPQESETTMSLNLKDVIFRMSKDQLLDCLKDPSICDDALRSAVFVLVGGNPEDLAPSNGAAVVAPAASAPVAAAAPKPAKGRKTAAPAAPVAGAPDAVTTGLLALAQQLGAVGKGFALSQVVTVTGATRSQCQRALKNAVAAGQIHGAGDRRFSRYGLTAAIATAQSALAQAGNE